MRIGACAAALAFLIQPTLHAESIQGSASERDACAGLKANSSVVTDTKVEAGARATQKLCVVHGAINSSPTSTIHFRLDLPERADWNGNLLMIGGGGFDGFVPTDVPEGTADLVKLLGPDAEQISGFFIPVTRAREIPPRRAVSRVLEIELTGRQHDEPNSVNSTRSVGERGTTLITQLAQATPYLSRIAGLASTCPSDPLSGRSLQA